MNPQPVSLADELRKTVEDLVKWKLVDGSADAYFWRTYWLPKLRKALSQHAVAEPQTPVDEPKNDERGYGCHNCGKQGLKKGQRVSFVYCNECVGVGIGRPAHAAEQPELTGLKYFPLPWHPDEGEPEGAQVYDANNHAVLMLFWPGHPVEETETVERETYALMRLIAKLVNEHFALLTSPVAPPPQEQGIPSKWAIEKAEKWLEAFSYPSIERDDLAVLLDRVRTCPCCGFPNCGHSHTLLTSPVAPPPPVKCVECSGVIEGQPLMLSLVGQGDKGPLCADCYEELDGPPVAPGEQPPPVCTYGCVHGDSDPNCPVHGTPPAVPAEARQRNWQLSDVLESAEETQARIKRLGAVEAQERSEDK